MPPAPVAGGSTRPGLSLRRLTLASCGALDESHEPCINAHWLLTAFALEREVCGHVGPSGEVVIVAATVG